MGAKQSLGIAENTEQQKGFFQNMISKVSSKEKKGFVPLHIPEIINLEYILNNRPNLPNLAKNIQQNSQEDNSLKIAQIILDYNNTFWNFGNIITQSEKNTKNSHILMNENSYKKFLDFVKSKIISNNSVRSNNASYKIIDDIRKIGFPQVNKFFTINLSKLFPDIKGLSDIDIINVTLLGLAAIIGAEHLVIYFLMCGANPNITYSSENKDTATLMLSYQIAMSKIDSFEKYFISLERMLYILFLLGSVRAGVDLSNIYILNYKISKKNQGLTEIHESILNQLVGMSYDKEASDLSIDKSLASLTMKNGASIPLLFKLLEKNNIIDGPKFWSNINSQGLPFGYTVLYTLLINNNINKTIKLSLVYYLIELGADPFILPNIRQNNRVKESIFAKENKNEIQLLIALLEDSNITIMEDLINILSKNSKFKEVYNKVKINTPILKKNKNITFEQLSQNNERLKKILSEVQKQKKIQFESYLTEERLYKSINNIPSSNSPKISSNSPKKIPI